MQPMDAIETGEHRYQPQRDPLGDTGEGYTLDHRTMATMVGLVALFLPIVMLIGVAFGVCFYQSLSHFYYAQFLGAVFVAAITFIGTFMLAYRGDNDAESLLAKYAAVAAFVVALFPTSGRGCNAPSFEGRALLDFALPDATGYVVTQPESDTNSYFELFSGAEYLHYGAALFLFVFLAWYCFRVFTRIVPNKDKKASGALEEPKRARNIIYYVSGSVIVVSIAAMLVQYFAEFPWWNEHRLTFWFESFALWAFGISWVVKGRLFNTVLLDEGAKHPKTG